MSLPLVIFPDVELLLTAYLRAALTARTEPYAAGVFVGVTVPSERRARMVLVRRDGGPRLDVARESARIGVNVWAATDQDCADLARLVRALLWSAPDGSPICKVTELSGPSPIADEVPRLYCTFELVIRGTDLT